MNKEYYNLFKQVATNCAIAAEENQSEDSPASQFIAKNFQDLMDKFTVSENPSLTRSEYLQLLAGCMIVKNQLLTNILKYQEAVKGYSLDTIPKLERIMNETKTEEEAQTLASQLFDKTNT